VGAQQRYRNRRPARREALLDPRPRILIVCEGEVTEPTYFSDFQKWCRNPRVRIQVEGPAGVPLTLVKAAKRLKNAAENHARREKDENLLFEEVWCVFDRDEHPEVPAARQFATDNGLRLAMSNPCFELWLILHIRENPGAQHRHALQKLIGELTPDVRAKHVEFELLSQGYDEAVRRAERLETDAIGAGEPTRNPTTEVFHLTDSIDPAGSTRRNLIRVQGRQLSLNKATAAAQAAFAQAERETAETSSNGDDSNT
jgi:hypothetical protein